jgi:hypothetical protein
LRGEQKKEKNTNACLYTLPDGFGTTKRVPPDGGLLKERILRSFTMRLGFGRFRPTDGITTATIIAILAMLYTKTFAEM